MTSPDAADLTARFEAARQLGALSYRMLGSIDDAQDAVQEAWLRLDRSGGADIANLDAWLTTVVARICLNMLRDRRTRDGAEPAAHLPDPIVEPAGEFDPEHRAMLADAVGMALFVVLDTLPPAERLAFVLHDVFAVPFAQIAAIVDGTPESARKLRAGRSGPGRRPGRAARGGRRLLRGGPQRGLRAATRGPSARHGPRRSTAPRVPSSSSQAAPRRSWVSWCAAAGSARSTCWRIRTASRNWSWVRYAPITDRRPAATPSPTPATAPSRPG